MSVENKQYVCEVILPENSPIHSATGKPSSRKAIAKRSAAFEACLLLRKGKYLDEHLIPIYHRQLPAMRNARLAVNTNKCHSYVMRVKPDVWEEYRGSRPTELYVTMIELKRPENLARPCQPLAILTRTRLPNFPPFPLRLQVGKDSDVLSTSFSQSFKVTDSALAALTEFTLRIYKDIFNKEFQENQAQMSYWLAPILSFRPTGFMNQSPDSIIDWLTVDNVSAHKEIRWTEETRHDQLIDRFLVDIWDGQRRFYSINIDPSLGPLDPVPQDAAVWKDRKDTNKGVKDILDYTVRLFGKTKAAKRQECNLKQPVIVAHKIPTDFDRLNKPIEDAKRDESKSYLCPGPLVISVVSVYCRNL